MGAPTCQVLDRCGTSPLLMTLTYACERMQANVGKCRLREELIGVACVLMLFCRCLGTFIHPGHIHLCKGCQCVAGHVLAPEGLGSGARQHQVDEPGEAL